MKIGIISGGFDPLHSGHLSYIKAAKNNCDFLMVGVNSDKWLINKKGKPFMNFNERFQIINALQDVNLATEFNDEDGSATELIIKASKMFANCKLIFMNGGDRTKVNIPEMNNLRNSNVKIKFEFNIGGNNKLNSSSKILEDFKKPIVIRPWGLYRVLDKQDGWAVKELTLEPGKSLSDQRHFFRSEHWHVVEGEVCLDLEFDDGKKENYKIKPKQTQDIPKLTWHRAYNPSNKKAKVIEIWFGEKLTEDDIERRNY